MHTGEKPPSCNTCGKSSIQIGELESLKMIHSKGNYKFTCKTFSIFFCLHVTKRRPCLWAFNPPTTVGLWPIFNVPGVKKSGILTIFGPVLANLEDFLTEKKKNQ